MNQHVNILPGLPRPDVATMAAPIDLEALTTIAAEAGETIRDIFERQKFMLPVIAFLNGEIILRGEWDTALCSGAALLFLQLPAGGDGNKDVFRFILQIAITVVAVYFLGPAGLGLSGAALQAGVAVASLAGGYLINLALPPSVADASSFKSGEAASPTYSVTPQGNQARLGGAIPRVYGRHMLVPDLAAQPYTEYVGNDLFLYQLFSLGLGQSQVHQVRIAKTELWNEDDGYSDSFDDIEIEIVEPGLPVTLAPFNVITAVEVSGAVLKGTNEDGAGWLGPFVASAAGDNPNFLALDFAWRGGSGHLRDSGAISGRATIIRQEKREIDEVGNPVGDWILLSESPFEFATRTAQRVSLKYPSDGLRYEVRCKRVNESATDARDWDEVTWDALRAYLPGDNTFAGQVMAVKMRATNQISQQAARDFSVVQTSLLPSYDGESWSAPVPTRAIFDIAMDVLRNDTYSAAHPDDRIDIDTLFSMHATWTGRGDTFDGVFDQTQSVWDVLTDVLMVGRARPIEIGDTISFVRDELVTVPKLLVTPRQVAEGSFGVDYALFDPSTPDDVVIEYMDERTWDTAASVRATLDGSASINPARRRIKGITDRHRAWQYGMYLAAGFKYRREFPSFSMEFDGRLLSPLDLVPVVHPLCDWGRSADIVDFNGETGELALSQKALLSDSDDNHMMLRRPDGRRWGPVLVTAGSDPYSVLMDGDSLADIIGAQGDPADFIVTLDGSFGLDVDIEPTTAVLGHGDMYMADCKLLGIRKQGADKITLSLVVDDPRVYEAGETGAPPAEETPSPLPTTPKGPEIAKLTVAVLGTAFHPELFASIRPAPGALNYIWQISYDHVHFQMLQDGLKLSWSSEVSPTTVWLRVTAIGAVRGPFIEWFMDLTAAEVAPSGVSAISTIVFVDTAFVKYSLPDEDEILGVLVRYSDTTGFDPESEGTSIDYSSPVSQVTVPLDSDPTYVRIAPYNVFGTAGLNWSTELSISPRKLPATSLSAEVVQSLATADTLEGNYVLRKGTGDFIGGMSLIGTGEAGDPIEAAFLVDKFQIAVPTEVEGVFNYVPAFEVSETGEVKINELVAGNITTSELYAKLVEIGTLIGLIIRGPGATIADALLVIDTQAPYILMKSAP